MSQMTPAVPSGVGAPEGVAGGPVPSGRRRRGRRAASGRRPLWLMAPGGLLMLVVIGIPFALAVWMSLTALNQYTLRRWVSAPFRGISNYTDAVNGPLLHSLRISVEFSVLTTLLTIPIGLAAAFAAHDRFRGRAVVRSVFLIPYVLPTFVVGTVWSIMLGPKGAVNTVLDAVGVNGGNWLIGGRAFWALVLIDTWAAWPFIYLLALAGLQSIGHEVHEAAAMDGATWWQKMRYVILPNLRGPISLAVVIGTLHHLNNFTLPFLLFGIPAPNAVNVLPVAIYSESFETFQFGLAAAMSVVSLVLVLIPLLIYLRAVRLDVGPEKGEGR